MCRAFTYAIGVRIIFLIQYRLRLFTSHIYCFIRPPGFMCIMYETICYTNMEKYESSLTKYEHKYCKISQNKYFLCVYLVIFLYHLQLDLERMHHDLKYAFVQHVQKKKIILVSYHFYVKQERKERRNCELVLAIRYLLLCLRNHLLL